MRLKLIFGILFLCLISGNAGAATNGAGNLTAETVALNLANRLVGNVPLGAANRVTLSGTPTVVTAATQSALVNITDFLGIVNGAALIMPATGIMLTTGSITGGTNALASAGDVDVATAIAATTITTFDAATLTFSFTVPAGMTHISLDMIFATNEALGLVPAIRDAVVVMVDGANVAKFVTPDPASILMSNVNTTSIFPAIPLGGIISGFDKVSQRQTILAPLLVQPIHTIKISIADHVDNLRDSAVLLSNMVALNPAPAAAQVAGTGVTTTQGTGVGISPTPNWLAVNANDTIAPRVRIIGSSTVHVMQHGLYIDQGAIAVDNIDGNLTGKIVTTNPVNTAVPATYTVTYSASDFVTPTANTGTATRTVIVHATTALDVLPPVVTPPADILLTATDFEGVLSSDTRLTAFLGGSSATDNVALAGVAVVDPATLPTKLPVGKTVVTFKAIDTSGNIGTASATVTVVGTNQTKSGANGVFTDLDLDGMPDSWEIAVFGDLITATSTPAVAPAVTPTISDFDLDGLNDLIEWQLGTNPKLANSNTASVSTDSWSVIFSNNPSDTDGDGVIDALEDAASVKLASKVSGLPVSAGSAVKYSIDTTAAGAPALDRVHVDVPGAGAPANILPSFGVLSFRVNSGGVNLPVRVTASVPFGTSAQFYKVNAAGVYSLIPLSSYNIVNASTVDFLLTDGGPLDLDAVTGTITDPIAIGSAPQVLGGSGPSGGCSIAQPNDIDPLLPVLVLFAMLYLIRSRKTSIRA